MVGERRKLVGPAPVHSGRKRTVPSWLSLPAQHPIRFRSHSHHPTVRALVRFRVCQQFWVWSVRFTVWQPLLPLCLAWIPAGFSVCRLLVVIVGGICRASLCPALVRTEFV